MRLLVFAFPWIAGTIVTRFPFGDFVMVYLRLQMRVLCLNQRLKLVFAEICGAMRCRGTVASSPSLAKHPAMLGSARRIDTQQTLDSPSLY